MNSKSLGCAFLAVGALVLSGCISAFSGREFVRQESAEERILAGLEDFNSIDNPVSVDCDGVEDIPFEVGETFTCTGMTDNGEGFVVEGTLTDTEQRRFEYVLTEIVGVDGTSRSAGSLAPESVAETILAGLANTTRVDDPVSIDCAGVEEVLAVVGKMFTCTGVAADGERFVVGGTFTDIDEGTFDFEVIEVINADGTSRPAGSLTAESVEESILAGLADSTRVDDPVSIDCAGVEEVPLVVDEMFTCTGVAANGEGFVVEGTMTVPAEGRYVYEVTEIVDEDGTSRPAGSLTADSVAETILAGLADSTRVDDPVSVDCSGIEEVPLIVGETFTCKGVQQNGETFDVLVRLSSDDGRFQYAVAR